MNLPPPTPIATGSSVRFKADGDTGLAYQVTDRIGDDCDLLDYRGRKLPNVPVELLEPLPPLPFRRVDEFNVNEEKTTMDQELPTDPMNELPSPSNTPSARSIPPLPLEQLTESHPSAVRPLQDNVLLYLKPRPERLAGGLIALPATRGQKANGAREAIVVASGPGWRLRGGRGPLVETGVSPGDCVVVDARAGQDWALDVGKPRTNPLGCEWQSFPVPSVHERVGGEYRMVRADEILMVLEDQRPEDEAIELDLAKRGA